MKCEKTLHALMGAGCGLVSFGLDFGVVSRFLARGVPDPVWMVLMLLLPAAAAVLLLRLIRRCPPHCVFWGLAVQWGILIPFGRAVGAELGFQLGELAWDLFDWIAYLMFALGWSAGGTLVQFLVLTGLRRVDA